MSPEDIDRERAAVVAEATTWIGTPYHTKGRIKGAGVDCLTLLAEVYQRAGVVDYVAVPHYPGDWHLHRDVECYLYGKDDAPGILHYCQEVPGPPERQPLPGDIVLWKFGMCFAHGTIVTQWPVVLHAYVGKKVGTVDTTVMTWLTKYFENIPERGQPRPRRFFTVKRWT